MTECRELLSAMPLICDMGTEACVVQPDAAGFYTLLWEAQELGRRPLDDAGRERLAEISAAICPFEEACPGLAASLRTLFVIPSFI